MNCAKVCWRSRNGPPVAMRDLGLSSSTVGGQQQASALSQGAEQRDGLFGTTNKQVHSTC